MRGTHRGSLPPPFAFELHLRCGLKAEAMWDARVRPPFTDSSRGSDELIGRMSPDDHLPLRNCERGLVVGEWGEMCV